MRHRRRGRKFGRKPSHQRALLRHLACSLMLSERDDEVNEAGYEYRPYEKPNKPKVKGRIITTLAKAKEVRPLVEKCVTIARRSLAAREKARQYAPPDKRGTEAWKAWRASEQWQKWNQAIAPAVAARRRCIQLLGNKRAVEILFDEIARRFADRDGGYTRILKLATPRLGDAGPRAILEFVGKHDRVRRRSERPAFEDEPADNGADASAPSPAAAVAAGAGAASGEAEATADPSADDDQGKTS